ncbi:MAG: 1,2-phenylacetyl-CoA epoxidase, subunit A (EC [uncultured Caballeronia sp.]|nr:MAG: 1,2-phenylacetyl-CoA epoxidase, subunit A (EC [uncultured Caballeronia sp.]
MYTQSLDIPGNVQSIDLESTSPELSRFDAVMVADARSNRRTGCPRRIARR